MKVKDVSKEFYTWVMFVSGNALNCRGLYADRTEAICNRPKNGRQVKFHLFKTGDILDQDLPVYYSTGGKEK